MKTTAITRAKKNNIAFQNFLRNAAAITLFATAAASQVQTAKAAAYTLTSASSYTYTQTFDTLGLGLADSSLTGWGVYIGGSTTALGTASTTIVYTGTTTSWSATPGTFKNVAAIDTTPTGTASSSQTTITDRALGIQMTGAFGDNTSSANAWGTFAFNFVSTGMTFAGNSTALSLKMQEFSSSTRSTTYSIQYGTGASPTSWTSLGTWGDPGAVGSTTLTFTGTQLSELSNQSNAWIRIAPTAATGTSGTRDGIAIDDFVLSYASAVVPGNYWVGGSNSWSSSSTSFATSSGGTTGSTQATTGALVFDTASAAPTVNDTVTVNAGITFGANGISISPGTGTPLISLAGASVAANALAVTNAGDTATISVKLTGSNGLTMSGPGKLVLSGDNSGLTGAVTLSAGTLRGTVANALGGGTLAISGGTLELANDSNTSFGRNTTISANTTIKSDRTTSGAGTTQTLGTLSIGAQTLTIDKGSNVASGTAGVTFGAVTLSGAPTFTANSGALLTLASITGTNTALVFGGAGSTTVSGAIATGTGTLNKSGAGTLTLSGTNTYTGNTSITGGKIALSGSSAAIAGNVSIGSTGTLSTVTTGAAASSVGGNVTLATGGTMDLTAGNLNVGGKLTITGGDLNYVLGKTMAVTGILDVSGSVNINLSGSYTIGSTYTLLTYASSGSTSLTSNTFNIVGPVGVTTAAFDSDLTTAGAFKIFVRQLSSALTWNATDGTWNKSTANWVKADTTASAFTDGDTVTFNKSTGGTITIASTVSPGSVTVSAASGTYTFSGAGGIGGTSSTLTKSGNGTLVLSTTNTYTGDTTLSAGTLRATTAGALGTNNLVISGGTLELANDSDTSFGRNTTISANTTIKSDRTTSGAGTTQTLGTLSIGAQTLTIDKGSNVASGTAGVTFGAVTLSGAPTFTVNSGALLTLASITGTAQNLVFNGAGNTTVSGAIATTTGTLNKSGAGTLTLSGTNTYTGATNITGGIVSASAGAFNGTSGITVNGATLTAVDFNSGIGLTVDGTGSATFNGSANQSVGALSNQGTVNFSGSRTVTVSSLSGAGTTTFASNATITGGISTGAVNVAGNLSSAISGGTVYVTGTTNGAISGGSATVGGTAAITTLSGANTTLTLNGANNTISTVSSSGTSTLTLGGTTSITTLTTAGSGGIAVNADTTIGTLSDAAITIAADKILTINSGSSSTAITGNGALTKATVGSLTLSGANNYTGATAVNAGTLNLGASDLTLAAVTNAGTLNFTSTSGTATLSSLSGAGTTAFSADAAVTALSGNAVSIASGKTLTVSSGTTSGIISGAGSLTKNGNGTLTLNGANSYTGATTINGGTLAFGTAQTLNNLQGSNSAATLALSTNNLTINGSGTSTYQGAITGTGALAHTGSGTVNLSGNNSGYSGNITVSNAGTLKASSNNALGTGAVTVTSGTVNAANGITVSNDIVIGTAAASSMGSTTTLQSWNFFGQTTVATSAAQTVASGIDTGTIGETALTYNNLTRGTTATASAAANSFRTVGFQNNGISTSNTDYFQWVVSTTSAAFNLTEIGAKFDGTSSFYAAPGVSSQFAYSLDGTTFNLIGSAASITSGRTQTVDLSGVDALQGLSASTDVYFRYYASGQTSTGGWGYISANNTSAADGLYLKGALNSYTAVSGSGTLGIDTAGTANFSGNITNNNLATLTAASGGTANFSGVISGKGSINKTGAGTVYLSGTNTFTGAVTVSEGTLSVASIGNGGVAGNLGRATNAAANIVFAGGTLQYTGAGETTDRAFTLGSGATGTIIDASGTGALVLSAAAHAYTSTNVARTLTLTGTNTGTNEISGLIANTGTGVTSLTKTGAGTWKLSGTNTFTGVTTINNGTLSVATIGNGGVAGNLGQASNAAANLVLGGGTLLYTGSSASSDRNFTLTTGTTSTINVSTAGQTLTLSGSTTNTTGALTKAGAGNLTLSGTNLYTGVTTISAGTLSVANIGLGGAASGTTNLGRATNAAANIVFAGGTLQYTGAGETTDRAFTLGSGATGTIIDASGTGALVLSAAAHAYTSTNVARTLTLTGTNTGTNEISGLIANTGTGVTSLTKTGAGTWKLSGTNTFTGVTTINNGILNIGSAGSIASSAVTVANGATLKATNSSMPASAVTGAITLNSGALVDLTEGSLKATSLTVAALSGSEVTKISYTIGNSFALTGGLTLNGNLSLDLTSALTGEGNYDVLTWAGATAPAGAGDISFVDHSTTAWTMTGQLTSGKYTIKVAKPFVNGGALTGGTVTVPSGSTVGAVSGATTVSAAATTTVGPISGGTVNLSGANNTVGAISGGTVNLNAAGSTVASLETGGTLNVKANSTVTSLTGGNLSVDSGVNVTVNSTSAATSTAVLSGAGSLVKTGNAKLTLSGDSSTFTGAVNVAAGTLEVSSVSALGSGTGTSAALSLGTASNATAAKLSYTGGAGTISKDITALSTATAGNIVENASTAGALTLSGSLAKNGTVLTLAGGTGGINVTGVISGAAANSDLYVTGTGTVTLSQANTYNGPTFVQDTATLIANNASATGAGIVNVASGATLQVGTSTNYALTLSTGGFALTNGSTIRVFVGSVDITGLTVNSGSNIDTRYTHYDLTNKAGVTYSTLLTSGSLDLSGFVAGGEKITIEVVSANANTQGLLFDPFYDFKFLQAGSVNLGANANLTDLFTIDTTGLKYATGSNSVAAQYNGQSLSDLIKVYTVTNGGNTVLMMSIPEPSTYGLALGALALAAVAIRRRKQKKSVA